LYFFMSHHPTTRPPHSFPTRRSSDLAPSQHTLVDGELRSRDPRPGEPGRFNDAGTSHGRTALRVAQQGDRHVRPRRRVILRDDQDRKSTRLNSSHVSISYAVFCLKKK